MRALVEGVIVWVSVIQALNLTIIWVSLIISLVDVLVYILLIFSSYVFLTVSVFVDSFFLDDARRAL